jgi:hypothetical protein
VPISPDDKAQRYREQAQTLRQAAPWLSMTEQRQQFLADAKELEAMAESEEGGAQAPSGQDDGPDASV